MRDSDIAYDRIKKLIMTAELKPGEIIVESELMERFNMGRTPIREALSRLSWDEQVRTIPRKCFLVSEFPLEKMESIYQMRLTLTALEGELVTKKATADDIICLRQVVKDTINETEHVKKVMCEREFHRTISKTTRNFLLEKTMNNVTDLCIRFMFLNKQYLAFIDKSVTEELEEIINNIEARNVSETVRLLTNHVKDFQSIFMGTEVFK